MSLPYSGASTSATPSSYPIEAKNNDDAREKLLSSPHSQSPKLPAWLQSKIDSNTLTRLQLVIFIILEVAFIALAAVCLVIRIPLRIPVNDSAIIGSFTVLFVTWQRTAILMGTCFVADVFSQEWSFQLTHIALNGDSLGTIDRVSTMTSGLVDRVLHLRFDKSSGTFKLAFLASLLLVALSSLASGTINATYILTNTPMTIQIGRLLSDPANNDIGVVVTAQSRANLILRLERIENSRVGFNLPDNLLTVVPMMDLSSFNGTIEYNSDVIEFHHDCHWEAPQFFNTSDGTIVTTAGGQQWIGATVGNGPIKIGSSVGPLSLTTLPIMEQVGIPAFIFSGGNASIYIPQSNPPTPFAINLESLPVTLTPFGAGLDLNTNSVYAPLSTVLICDPRPEITGGRIRVTDDGTLTVVASGQTPIGNIPLSAANLIFTNAFQVALVQLETGASINAVNNVASNMFMSNASTLNWDTARNIRPLDLPSINKNMDTYMLSAAKAYIDGHNRNGINTAADFALDTVSAAIPKQELQLFVSERLFIITTVLVVIITFLLFAIFTSVQKKKGRLFNLSNAYAILKEKWEKEEGRSFFETDSMYGKGI